MTSHNFAYGASRVGKTTLAAQAAAAGHKVLAVTMEPGVTLAAFRAVSGASCITFTPNSSEELFVFLEYHERYLQKHYNGFTPTFCLFDNLAGLQGLLIGQPGDVKREVNGLEIPAKPPSGIIGNIPKGKGDVSNPEALSQAQYGVLGRYTRRLLNAIDNLPFHTLVTSIEQLDYDEKYKKDSQGLPANQAAGRPRKVKGWPRTEGTMTKLDLPALVSGAFLHLVKEKGQFLIHTSPHTYQDVEWFADPRGLKDSKSPINWTNKSVAEELFPLTTPTSAT